MTNLEFHAIPGHDGFYITQNGIVYNEKTDRVIKHTVRSDKYHIVWVSGKNLPVHQLVLMTFVGPKPFPKAVVRHLDGNPHHNMVSNLKWGTYKENSADMLEHGRCTNANKTHCNNGHEYTKENTFILKASGKRSCVTCRAIWQAAYAERRAELRQKSSV